MSDLHYKVSNIWDKDRSLVWKEIVRYLSTYIPREGTVLDIGAGYCDFINNVIAKKKIALDRSPEFSKYAESEVETIQSSVTDMSKVPTNSIDLLFSSNMLEHLTDDEISKTTEEIRRVLKKDGTLILMQPNYRLSPKHYFDDPTHIKIFTDDSLEKFLKDEGFQIVLKKSKFLPLSMKSKGKLPASSLIVRSYLYSPWKPFAGQMLFVSKKV